MPVADDDTVVNTGKVATTASAEAIAAVGFSFGGASVATNQAWDGGTTSRSTANGIATGRGADDITNSGIVGVTADANTVAASASVTVFGVAGAASTATSDARATAIDGGDGNDFIRNLQSGALTMYAESTAVGVKASITGIGVSASIDGLNGGTTGTATATAIDGGKGQDSIVNHAVVNATADATAFSNTVAISRLARLPRCRRRRRRARMRKAIDGGDDADIIANDADITAKSLATGTVVNVAVTAAGVSAALDATWNGGTTATATATGIDGGAGDDTVLHAVKTVTADAASDTIRSRSQYPELAS